MRVLLTGGSSFTGMWFAEALAEAGAIVTAPPRGHMAKYEGVRAVRARRVEKVATVIEAVEFGSDACICVVERQSFGVLCHHAARVTAYRTPDSAVATGLAD